MYAGDTGGGGPLPRSIDSMARCFTCSRTFSSTNKRKKILTNRWNLTLFLKPFQHPALGPAGNHQPIADITADHIFFAGGFHPAATIMSTDENVLNLEMLDGILQHGSGIHIVISHHIGDTAMHENFPRLTTEHLFCRYAGLTTAADGKRERRYSILL